MARAQAQNGAHVPSVESVFFLIDTAVATEQAFPTCHLAQLSLLVTAELLMTSRLEVEPGKPGAEVSKTKNYKSKQELAYRMRTVWPTTAMPKPSFLSERDLF